MNSPGNSYIPHTIGHAAQGVVSTQDAVCGLVRHSTCIGVDECGFVKSATEVANIHIVSGGRRPDGWALAFNPNGHGRPERQDIAGIALTADVISFQQQGGLSRG